MEVRLRRALLPLGITALHMLQACSERRASAPIDTSLLGTRRLPIRATFPYHPQGERFSVVRDSISWANWRTAAGALDQGAVINWQREGVIAVVAPEFASGPAPLEFTSAGLNDDTLTIEYRLVFSDILNDYGSQELGAIALPQIKIGRHVVRVYRIGVGGQKPILARPLPNER